MTEMELDEVLNEWAAPAPPARLRAKTLAAYRQRKGQHWFRWAMAASIVLAMVALGALHFDFEPKIGAGWAVLGDGTHVRTRTLVEPRMAVLKYFRWGGSTTTSGQRQRRCLYDRAGASFSCYESWIESLSDRRYRVSFFHYEPDEAERRRMGVRDAHPVVSPPLPAPAVVREGEAVIVELCRPSPGDRIFDEITLSRAAFTDTPDQRPLGEGPFGNDMLRIASPRLTIDGMLLAEGAINARGVSVWFVLPGEGRWVLTTRPGRHTGFRPAGYARGTALEFEHDGRAYRIDCAEPVVSGRERKLYVLHEPHLADDHPLSRSKTAMFGSAGPPELFE